MKKALKKIPLAFNEKRYNDDVKLYENKLSMEAKIDLEVNKLLHSEGIVIENKTKTVEEFYNIFHELNKHRNPMELTGQRLTELHGLECINLDVMEKNYKPLAEITEPKTEDYTIWAETETEIARFELATNLIESIFKLNSHFKKNRGAFPLFEMRKTFNGILDIDTRAEVLIPNIRFVKNEN
jgi:hypothetical protein